MDDGPDLDRDLGHPPRATGDLLVRIAEILDVDPAFFLQGAPGSAPRAGPHLGDELRELLRLFNAIDDPDMRRAALDLVRRLAVRDGEA